SKLGRYRIFPIIGTSLLIISFWLFSHIAIDISRVLIGIWMVILGTGVGMVMPVMTLAVHNGVDRKDLGTATSSVTFFRSIGASLGTAIFGAILINRLSDYLMKALPGGTGTAAAKSLGSSAAGLKNLPPAEAHTILTAFGHAFGYVFLIGIPFAILALIVAYFLKETPLSTSTKEKAETDLGGI
ncbi:MAG: hypothetical protein ACREJM_02530, partial [Candidatus Saccharimonadales bacterium]